MQGNKLVSEFQSAISLFITLKRKVELGPFMLLFWAFVYVFCPLQSRSIRLPTLKAKLCGSVRLAAPLPAYTFLCELGGFNNNNNTIFLI